MGNPVASRNPSERARGTAEPPHGIARRAETSLPSNSGKTPIQIVGTPAATVTFSVSIMSAREGALRSAPGITIVDPVATAACANPQALAWNIGTTGRTTSRSQTPIVSAIIAPNVWSTIERCE